MISEGRVELQTKSSRESSWDRARRKGTDGCAVWETDPGAGKGEGGKRSVQQGRAEQSVKSKRRQVDSVKQNNSHHGDS